MTTRIPLMPECRAKRDTEWRSTGCPARSRYCLGTSPPNRVPAPAATMMAIQFVMAGLLLSSPKLVRAAALAKRDRCIGTRAALYWRHAAQPDPESVGIAVAPAGVGAFAATDGGARRPVLEPSRRRRRRAHRRDDQRGRAGL